MRRLHRVVGVLGVAIALAFISMGYTNCALEEGGPSVAELGSEFSGQISGRVTVIERSGLVSGYAYDAQNPGKKMRVHFVIDGAEDAGTYLGSVLASDSSPGTYSGYYYSYQIPTAYHGDGSHTLYVYGHEVSSSNRLMGSPQSFTILVPQAEAFFISSGLRTYITNNCNGCHSWAYRDLFYGPLSNPDPLGSGTRTNNELVLKMNGGSSHPRRFCNSNADFPCSAVLQWWDAEFN
jgi:hypothetical protein